MEEKKVSDCWQRGQCNTFGYICTYIPIYAHAHISIQPKTFKVLFSSYESATLSVLWHVIGQMCHSSFCDAHLSAQMLNITRLLYVSMRLPMVITEVLWEFIILGKAAQSMPLDIFYRSWQYLCNLLIGSFHANVFWGVCINYSESSVCSPTIQLKFLKLLRPGPDLGLLTYWR